MAYRVEPVAYKDTPYLADAIMRAVYEDEHYALLFRMVPVQEVIDNTAKRMPKT
jgi:hypothetical protein